MREGKTTIIDLGTLPTCTRRQKIAGYFEDFETYSALAFLRWLRSGGNYDEATLVKTLVEACRNLPDTQDTTQPKTVIVTNSANTSLKATAGSCSTGPGKVPVDLPAGTRFIQAATGSATGIVPTKSAGGVGRRSTGPHQRNKLFTGDWATNLAARRVRVGQILSFISKTFDASLCQGIANDIDIGKHDVLARKHCPCGWRAANSTQR